MNRRDLEDVLTSTRNEIRERFKLPPIAHPALPPVSREKTVLEGILERVMPHIIKMESMRHAYEICYRHVFEMHDWPNWYSSPLEDRVEWMKDNLSRYGFDPDVPNLIGISDDIEATSFKTVWR